jgi:GNAT superfamily N-acetyltransferase
MRYREAQRHDISTIVQFQVAMALETEEFQLDPATCTRGVTAVFDRPELGRYFVAEEGDEIAGCLLTTFEWSDWRDGMVWWIQSVYVRSTFRKRGVYAGLYAHVKAIVEADRSLRGIRLYVDLRNVIAQQVYTRLGMNGEHYKLYEWMKS